MVHAKWMLWLLLRKILITNLSEYSVNSHKKLHFTAEEDEA